MSRRRTNTNTSRSMYFPKAAINFVSTVLLAMVFIAITDRIQPNLIQYVSARQQSTHPQSHQPQRGLRGSSRSQQQKASTTASSQIPKHIPDFEGEDKLIRHLNASSKSRIHSKLSSSCAQHNNNADASNSQVDELGNECRYCTNHLKQQVCVSDSSIEFKFSPCNNWLCYDDEDPSKSDVTACERV